MVESLMRQVSISLQMFVKVLPICGDLLIRPTQFFTWKSERPDTRRREALDLLAFAAISMACLYYASVAAVRPVKDLNLYFFLALVFNLSHLLSMSGIYAVVSWAVDPQKRFQLHLWNAVSATPILCLVALLTQDYMAAVTRQQLEGGAVGLTGWASAGPWVVLLGYVWCARLMYAAARHNARLSRWRAASIGVLGFGGTLVFLTFPLATSYGRLLQALVG